MIRKILSIGFFTSLFIISCKKGDKAQGENNDNNEKKAGYAAFSGEIVHPDNNSDTIIIYSNRRREYVKKIGVNNGKFNDTLHIKENEFFSFSYGNKNAVIYLKKGCNIHLNVDAKQFNETIKYKGEGAEASNYLAQFVLMRKKINEAEETRDYSGLSKVETDEKIENIRERFFNLLHNYKNLDSIFAAEQKKSINSYVSGIMTEILLEQNAAIFKGIHAYKNLSDKKVDEKIKEVCTKFLNVINSHKGLDSSIINELKTSCNFYLNQYKNRIDKGLALLKATKGISPVFTDYENIDGSKTSLKDLRGKYVYIDVWATRCSPCKHELPYLKELQQKYKGRKITFVSISVDDIKNRDKWIKMVKEEKLGGVQLLAKNSWKSNFISEYKINRIPTFILIDPQGKIVSPDTYRPSDKESIEALFTSLNI